MIHINLLPDEYRRRSRTPIKVVLGMSVAVTINTVLLAYAGWLFFGIQKEVDSQHQVLQLEMEGLTPQVNYHKSLDKESTQYHSREKTLAGITSSRIAWTRKLDELIDVVNRGDDRLRHLVWFDDLQTSQLSVSGLRSNYGSVRANGHSGSEKFAQVANFLEDVEASTFVDDFYKPAPPEGTQTEVDDTLVPSTVWSFPLSLSLRSPEEREAARVAREGPAEGAQGDETEAGR